MTSPSDSPSAPKPRRPTPPRWLLLIVAAIAFLFIAGWWTQRPLARIPLPDGGELLLVEAHYAPSFHASAITFWDRLRRRLTSEFDSALDDSDDLDFGDPEDPPSLWMIFESHAAAGQDPKPAEISQLGVWAMDSGLLVAHTTADSFQTTLGTRYIVPLNCYPRRTRQLQLRFDVEKSGQKAQTVHATIANPFPVSDAPRWTPEPLPQSRRLNAREVVLESLGLEPVDPNFAGNSISISCAAEIKVHEPGIPDDAFETYFSLSDATGNTGQDLLPLSEPVWRVRADVWANDKYPFPAANILSLGQTTMPGPGEFRILPLRADSTGTPRQAILAGRGWYRISYGKELTVEPIEPPAKNVPSSGPKGQIVECATSELLVGLSQPAANDFHQMWRIVVGQTVIPLGYAHGSGSNAWFQSYSVTYRGEDIPQGMGVETQSILSPVETVDFYIQPPKR